MAPLEAPISSRSSPDSIFITSSLISGCNELAVTGSRGVPGVGVWPVTAAAGLPRRSDGPYHRDSIWEYPARNSAERMAAARTRFSLIAAPGQHRMLRVGGSEGVVGRPASRPSALRAGSPLPRHSWSRLAETYMSLSSIKIKSYDIFE